MKQTILIHGAPYKEEFYDPTLPSPSNAHWFPWLQKQYALKDQLCQTPEFPKPFDPLYNEWKEVLENFTIHSDTTLIGHSCGAGFLMKYLSENAQLAAKNIFLIAPWLDLDHELSTNFFDFKIDKNVEKRNVIHVFYSLDDDKSILKSVAYIKENLPHIHFHQYVHKGHFCQSEFEELLPFLFS